MEDGPWGGGTGLSWVFGVAGPRRMGVSQICPQEPLGSVWKIAPGLSGNVLPTTPFVQWDVGTESDVVSQGSLMGMELDRTLEVIAVNLPLTGRETEAWGECPQGLQPFWGRP